MLNSLHRFFIPALSPAMFNVATIACAILLVPVMPAFGLPGIAAIAIATDHGGLGQILLQWPALPREGFRKRPILDFRDPALREILHLMGPGTLGLAAVQINVFVNTYLATTQPQGAVSWLNYAFRLMYLPIGLFGASIATAAVPEISRRAAAADNDGVRGTLSEGLRLMLILYVPASIGLVALALPIVAFLLERGRFTGADTAATAAALVCYAPGLIGYSAVKIASPTFYSLRDSRTPVLISVMTVGLNLTLNLILIRAMGYRGLALGTAVAAMFNATALLWLLRGRLGGIDGHRIATAFAKILTASALMGVAAWGTDYALGMVWPSGVLIRAHVDVWLCLRLVASIAAGIAVLIGSARVLRIEELDAAMSRVLRRVAGGVASH
jgi:putative peptidoglycan lipid II flippase